MILYFAGNAITAENEVFLTSHGLEYRLLSYADIDSWSTRAFGWWMSDAAPRPLFLDSGAFGAFTRNHHIDLVKYCEFIKQHPGKLYPVAALDVIGVREASYENWRRMQELGVHAMPTYHMGLHNWPAFREMLAETDYIALGGVVGATQETMQPWLDVCWKHIKDFWPKKVHIFGVMAQWCLERYPWYSADSSSALVGGGMGRVMSFEKGRMVSEDWQSYAQFTYDGAVMDGLSALQAKAGSAWKGRAILNIRSQLALQRYITDLWTARGITWEEPCAQSLAPSDTTSISTSSIASD